MTAYTVRKQGRTWGIFDSKGSLVEGGFFSRDAADVACAAWNAEAA